MTTSRGFAAISAMVSTLALTILACGGVDASGSLKDTVDDAMQEVPYEYRVLDDRSTESYIVFNVVNPSNQTGVNIAFGGKRSGKGCSPPPPLPVPHRKGGKPLGASGPEPLICFEDDSWRPRDSAHAVARANIANHVGAALCEKLYDAFTCFD